VTDLQDQPPATPEAPISKHPRDDRDGDSHPLRLVILAALLAFVFVRFGWALPVVILGVVVMIFLHELGHYLAARWGGMKVTEFFIGFGPKIWSFRRDETEYGLKVIPAGAYVKIIGMNNLDEVDPGDEGSTYREKSYPKRMLVAVAGSAMHFAQALVLLVVLYTFVGVPGGSLTQVEDWRVDDVAANSAAAEAGLQAGDRILEIDDREVTDFDSFAESVSELPAERVTLTVQRDGEVFEVPTTIGVLDEDPDIGLLGIRMEPITTTVGPGSAVVRSLSDFGDQSVAVLGFFGDFFTPAGISGFAESVAEGNGSSTPAAEAPSGSSEGSGSSDANRIMSIVGAVQVGSDLTESGMLGFLLFFVGINITIGIFNLIPLLPLDGGHVVVATYERLREIGRPHGERYHVDFARLIPVVYAVFFVLVLLGVATIYNDITNPITL
jgi:membrane-associated protease RseP (regulator of RpoE activity)